MDRVSFSHAYTVLLSLLLQQRLVIPAEMFQFHLAPWLPQQKETSPSKTVCHISELLWHPNQSSHIYLSLYICIVHLYTKEINRHSRVQSTSSQTSKYARQIILQYFLFSLSLHLERVLITFLRAS